jgi:hypothetical protein
MAQSADHAQSVSRVHWTARLGFSLPLGFWLLWLFTFVLPYLSQWFAFLRFEGWFSFISMLEFILHNTALVVAIPALIVSMLALSSARGTSWRRGRVFAILGCIMSLALCGYLALYIYFLCCVRFNLHFTSF